MIEAGNILILGTTTYTCMLNKLGGIESDLTVSVVEDDGPQAAFGVEGKITILCAMNLLKLF